MKDIYLQLRKPVAQVFSLFTFCVILFVYSSCFFSFSINDTPGYLLVSSGISICIIILCFIPFFMNKKPNDYSEFNVRINLFTIITILSIYNVPINLYNIYYFVASQKGMDLFSYWIFGVLIMIVSYIANISTFVVLKIKPQNFIGRTGKEVGKYKFLSAMFFQMLTNIIIIQKIIEFFLVPYIEGLKIIILISGFMMIVMNALVIFVFKQHFDAKLLFKKEDEK